MSQRVRGVVFVSSPARIHAAKGRDERGLGGFREWRVEDGGWRPECLASNLHTKPIHIIRAKNYPGLECALQGKGLQQTYTHSHYQSYSGCGGAPRISTVVLTCVCMKQCVLYACVPLLFCLNKISEFMIFFFLFVVEKSHLVHI